MKVKEFIQQLLINEVKSIQQISGHHYISFGLISQGIEFLGACLDNHEFNIRGHSAERYNNCITTLFPAKYHPFVKLRSSDQFDLYGNLRCGILHVFIPGPDIEVIQESEIDDYGDHLEIKMLRGRDRLILVSQKLMSDFEYACQDVIRRIDNRAIGNPKVYEEILSVSSTD